MTKAAEQDARPALPEGLVALLTGHLDVDAAVERLTPATTFESLGMDSMSLMELVVAAEQEFGIVLPAGGLDLFPDSTLGDAARAFEDAS
ncbi:acyl carrier protein [Kitasatospora sp. LaBMicrA B282]|uniref:acyl carrier protein n=1 Tax=Kitasatospora sp. LaBMicrA B282 TaxID=3420949 RepID=UPI003D0BFEE5